MSAPPFLLLSPYSVIMDFDFRGGCCALREGKDFFAEGGNVGVASICGGKVRAAPWFLEQR